MRSIGGSNLAEQRRPDLDVEEFFALDEAFHHALLRLSGHGSAWATVVSAKGHLDRARRLGAGGRVVECRDVSRAVPARGQEDARL